MNSTAVREAVATGFPRDRMYGVWWAAAEPDVVPVGADAKGYNGLALQHSDDRAKMHEDILKLVHDKGQGTGPQRGSRHRAVHARHDQRDAGVSKACGKRSCAMA